MVGPAENVTTDTQMGRGFHCGATDSAHRFRTGPFALSRIKNTTVAQLYVDVVKAFASLFHRIAIPGEIASGDLWLKHLASCGFSPAELGDVITMACTALKWEHVGCSQHALAILESAHLNTWLTVEGLRHISIFLS